MTKRTFKMWKISSLESDAGVNLVASPMLEEAVWIFDLVFTLYYGLPPEKASNFKRYQLIFKEKVNNIFHNLPALLSAAKILDWIALRGKGKDDDQESVVMSNKKREKFLCVLPKVEKSKNRMFVAEQNISCIIVYLKFLKVAAL
ncbi:unnamed protein product [Fraxinus pennsylvanica]|uniref:Uncharacterized protein n=1 Tax=Fraxinus pennsylvanica TaxID=56036 RepID=A0AAD1YZY1_9LAMI|nr:unnamed protein product [Fraxinus pennsylvanica]